MNLLVSILFLFFFSLSLGGVKRTKYQKKITLYCFLCAFKIRAHFLRRSNSGNLSANIKFNDEHETISSDFPSRSDEHKNFEANQCKHKSNKTTLVKSENNIHRNKEATTTTTKTTGRRRKGKKNRHLTIAQHGTEQFVCDFEYNTQQQEEEERKEEVII